MTLAYEAEQTRTIVKTVTADEPVSNICNSVNVNNVKSSFASSTCAVKLVIKSVKFNDIVDIPNVAEPLCSKIYLSNN